MSIKYKFQTSAVGTTRVRNITAVGDSYGNNLSFMAGQQITRRVFSFWSVSRLGVCEIFYDTGAKFRNFISYTFYYNLIIYEYEYE